MHDRQESIFPEQTVVRCYGYIEEPERCRLCLAMSKQEADLRSRLKRTSGDLISITILLIRVGCYGNGCNNTDHDEDSEDVKWLFSSLTKVLI